MVCIRGLQLAHGSNAYSLAAISRDWLSISMLTDLYLVELDFRYGIDLPRAIVNLDLLFPFGSKLHIIRPSFFFHLQLTGQLIFLYVCEEEKCHR